MKNAVTYMTRECGHACSYCSLTTATVMGKKLKTTDWIRAFLILKEMGADFNLILGNECWLLGPDLLDILSSTRVPYAVYTNCLPKLFEKYCDTFFGSGVLDNLSAGCDYPFSYLEEKIREGGLTNDMERKSYYAWKGAFWVREHFPEADTHLTMTIHAKNYHHLPRWLDETTKNGIFTAINFIHYNKDGKYDFFPSKEKLGAMAFQESDHEHLRRILNNVLKNPGLLQNPEWLNEDFNKLIGMGWHCQGDPYGGPTIDVDGSLRVCAYRVGTHTPKFSIFDLPKKTKEWEGAVKKDTDDCPGCSWSYPWLYHYWKDKNELFGSKVFSKHAGEHIKETNWSKRNIE